MKDVLMKNLTSTDRRKKILFSKETSEENGVRVTIHRNFVYLIRNIGTEPHPEESKRTVNVLKYHNSEQHIDKFFCRVKGTIYAVANGTAYHIFFLNSFKLEMSLA
jgi:hypothetical protein